MFRRISTVCGILMWINLQFAVSNGFLHSEIVRVTRSIYGPHGNRTHPRRLSVSFRAHRQSFNLQLFRDNEHTLKDIPTYLLGPRGADIYNGTLRQTMTTYTDRSRASLFSLMESDERSHLAGHVIRDDHVYYIRPHDDDHYIVERRAHVVVHGQDTLTSPRKRKWKRNTNPNVEGVDVINARIQVLVLMDYSLYQKYMTQYPQHDTAIWEMKKYFAHVINGVDNVYRNIQDPHFNIRVLIAGFVISTLPTTSPWFEDNVVRHETDFHGALKAIVDSYRAIDDMALKLSEYNTNFSFPEFDHAMSFTGYDLASRDGDTATLGLAYTRGICSFTPYWIDAVSLIEETGSFESILTAAHELAHSLGVDHDGDHPDIRCPADDKFLMSPSSTRSGAGSHLNMHHFSCCSKQQLRETLRSAESQCVLEPADQHSSFDSLVTDVAGQIYHVDQQCEQRIGNGSTLCQWVYDQYPAIILCEELWCTDPNYPSHCFYSGEPAHGTECHQGSWCVRGACVSQNDTVASSMFSGEMINPKYICCSLPDMAVHRGHVTSFDTELWYGSETRYACDAGYTATSGDLLRRCGLNARWSGSEPFCEPEPEMITDSREYLDRMNATLSTPRNDEGSSQIVDEVPALNYSTGQYNDTIANTSLTSPNPTPSEDIPIITYFVTSTVSSATVTSFLLTTSPLAIEESSLTSSIPIITTTSTTSHSVTSTDPIDMPFVSFSPQTTEPFRSSLDSTNPISSSSSISLRSTPITSQFLSSLTETSTSSVTLSPSAAVLPSSWLFSVSSISVSSSPSSLLLSPMSSSLSPTTSSPISLSSLSSPTLASSSTLSSSSSSQSSSSSPQSLSSPQPSYSSSSSLYTSTSSPSSASLSSSSSSSSPPSTSSSFASVTSPSSSTLSSSPSLVTNLSSPIETAQPTLSSSPSPPSPSSSFSSVSSSSSLPSVPSLVTYSSSPIMSAPSTVSPSSLLSSSSSSSFSQPSVSSSAPFLPPPPSVSPSLLPVKSSPSFSLPSLQTMRPNTNFSMSLSSSLHSSSTQLPLSDAMSVELEGTVTVPVHTPSLVSPSVSSSFANPVSASQPGTNSQMILPSSLSTGSAHHSDTDLLHPPISSSDVVISPSSVSPSVLSTPLPAQTLESPLASLSSPLQPSVSSSSSSSSSPSSSLTFPLPLSPSLSTLPSPSSFSPSSASLSSHSPSLFYSRSASTVWQSLSAIWSSSTSSPPSSSSSLYSSFSSSSSSSSSSPPSSSLYSLVPLSSSSSSSSSSAPSSSLSSSSSLYSSFPLSSSSPPPPSSSLYSLVRLSSSQSPSEEPLSSSQSPSLSLSPSSTSSYSAPQQSSLPLTLSQSAVSQLSSVPLSTSSIAWSSASPSYEENMSLYRRTSSPSVTYNDSLASPSPISDTAFGVMSTAINDSSDVTVGSQSVSSSSSLSSTMSAIVVADVELATPVRSIMESRVVMTSRVSEGMIIAGTAATTVTSQTMAAAIVTATSAIPASRTTVVTTTASKTITATPAITVAESKVITPETATNATPRTTESAATEHHFNVTAPDSDKNNHLDIATGHELSGNPRPDKVARNLTTESVRVTTVKWPRRTSKTSNRWRETTTASHLTDTEMYTTRGRVTTHKPSTKHMVTSTPTDPATSSGGKTISNRWLETWLACFTCLLAQYILRIKPSR